MRVLVFIVPIVEFSQPVLMSRICEHFAASNGVAFLEMCRSVASSCPALRRCRHKRVDRRVLQLPLAPPPTPQQSPERQRVGIRGATANLGAMSTALRRHALTSPATQGNSPNPPASFSRPALATNFNWWSRPSFPNFLDPERAELSVPQTQILLSSHHQPGHNAPMRPPRNPRKLLRTAFTAFTVLCIVGYVASGWYSLFLSGPLMGGILNGKLWLNYAPSSSAARDVALEGPYPVHFSLTEFDFVNDQYNGGFVLWLSLWPLVALLILANAFWFWRDWRNRRRPGFCPKCGYDLRATPNRCPECGHAPEPARP